MDCRRRCGRLTGCEAPRARAHQARDVRQLRLGDRADARDQVYLTQHEHSLGARPIRVLSTGNHGVHFLESAHPQDAEHQKYEQEVARAQTKWLAMSSNAKQLFTDKSSEYIPSIAEVRDRGHSRGVFTKQVGNSKTTTLGKPRADFGRRRASL